MVSQLPCAATHERLEAAYAQGMLRKEALQDGAYYQGHCRNATMARWYSPLQRFVYWRSKFGERFLEDIGHPEDEKTYDVFIPERELSQEAAIAANCVIRDEQVQRFFRCPGDTLQTPPPGAKG